MYHVSTRHRIAHTQNDKGRTEGSACAMPVPDIAPLTTCYASTHRTTGRKYPGLVHGGIKRKKTQSQSKLDQECVFLCLISGSSGHGYRTCHSIASHIRSFSTGHRTAYAVSVPDTAYDAHSQYRTPHSAVGRRPEIVDYVVGGWSVCILYRIDL
eukprot:3489909-Rhodomonas_salina.1